MDTNVYCTRHHARQEQYRDDYSTCANKIATPTNPGDATPSEGAMQLPQRDWPWRFAVYGLLPSLCVLLGCSLQDASA